MARYYSGQPEGMRALFGEAQAAEDAYLKQRYDISQRAVAQLLEAGGVTTSQSDFTLAMHGFSRGDVMGPAVETLFQRYDELHARYGSSERRPVAAIVQQDSYGIPQLLHKIGLVPHVRGWDFDASPLRYRVFGSVENPRGTVELPVKMHHQWTENRLDYRESELAIQDESFFVVASVQRTSDALGNVYPPVERAVDIASHLKVGWTAILGSYDFDEVTHSLGDRLFMDRVHTARVNFEQRFPAEVGAD